jgi:hypothetical protein
MKQKIKSLEEIIDGMSFNGNSNPWILLRTEIYFLILEKEKILREIKRLGITKNQIEYISVVSHSRRRSLCAPLTAIAPAFVMKWICFVQRNARFLNFKLKNRQMSVRTVAVTAPIAHITAMTARNSNGKTVLSE